MFSHSFLPVLFLPRWSFQLVFLWKSPLSLNIILCGWLGLKRPNNKLCHSCYLLYRWRITSWHIVPAGWPSHDGDVTVYVKDVNQLSLPTPIYSVLVSTSVFMAVSTVFRSINSPDNSPLSHSFLPVLFLPYGSFQLYISIIKVSHSPDIIPCGWLGLKHQLTN